MGRKARGWWDDRAQRWFARLGEIDEATGKSGTIMLRDESGEPVAQHDTEAKDRAIQRLVMARSRTRAVGGLTVARVCQEYLTWHRENGSALRTQKDHWYHLNKFSKFEHQGIRYADRPASEILPDDLWRIKQAGTGAIRQLYSSVLACWNWASSPIEGRSPSVLIPGNPLRGMKRPPKGKHKSKFIEWSAARVILRLMRAYARQQVKTRKRRTRVARWVKCACLTAMAYTGMRTIEATRLEWSDIVWDKSVIRIPSFRTKTRKTGRDRWIAVHPRVLRILAAIRRAPWRHKKYVFFCEWHTSAEEQQREFWRWLREDVKPYLELTRPDAAQAMPEGWQPYWFRHSFATDAAEEVGAERAAVALGHSKEVLEATYLHATLEGIQAVSNAVNAKRKRR
jgi:integrase